MVLLYRVLDKAKGIEFVNNPAADPTKICTSGEKGDFHPNKPGAPTPSYWTNSKIYAQELLRLSPGKVVVFQHFPVKFLRENAQVFRFNVTPDKPWFDVCIPPSNVTTILGDELLTHSSTWLPIAAAPRLLET